MKKKFIRTDSFRYSKLGKNRKKLQKWRKPKGRDNKMRIGFFGQPVSPGVGYKKARKEAGLIQGKQPLLVHNLDELEQADAKKHIVIVARVGARKKIEIIKKAEGMKLMIANVAKEQKK